MHRYNEVDSYYRIGSGENILHTILKSSHFFVGTGQLKEERQGFYSWWIYLLTLVGGKLKKRLKILAPWYYILAKWYHISCGRKRSSLIYVKCGYRIRDHVLTL